MTLEKLDNAIHELAEAKRLAQLFGYPEAAINRIDLVLRGARHYRKQIEQLLETINEGRSVKSETAAIQ